MCIPCVMCGACMADGSGERADDGRCPECGEPVPDNAVSCPKCFTFLYRATRARASSARMEGGERDVRDGRSGRFAHPGGTRRDAKGERAGQDREA